MGKTFPGVCIQEVFNGVRSIEGVRTSTTAFIGVTEKGPVGHALMVTSFTEFQVNFGNFMRESWLAYSVLQFFNNGGTHLYIARVISTERTATQEINYQKAFALLDPITSINLVAVPGIGSPSMVSYGAEYCQKRGDCFFIGDMSLFDNTKEKAQTFIDRVDVKNSYAAVYFPWLKVKDPSGALKSVPPSGSVAGIYARIDAKQGVWKAPAGKDCNINGTTELLVNISDYEQSELNLIGVNVIRNLPTIGIVIWGARTLATHSEDKYISVRRTAIFLQQSICNGIRWAIFEPNDENLWASLRLNISTFMMLHFRDGAFCGHKPSTAFFVKCDNETTKQADIDSGVVSIMVGFAPLKPGEFLILRLSQKAGQLK